MSRSTASPVHAIVPLAVFEAVRSLDLPVPDEMDEYHAELATKRLGMSRTVATQIERYAALAARNARVASEEVAGVLRLVGRRGDAGLVFSDAGRRAARLAIARVAPVARWYLRALPAFVSNRLGFVLARRIAARIFGLELRRDRGGIAALAGNPPSAHAAPDGAACGFYGSAVAALLRTLTDFDGALLHESCRGRGDAVCRWDSAGGASE